MLMCLRKFSKGGINASHNEPNELPGIAAFAKVESFVAKVVA